MPSRWPGQRWQPVLIAFFVLATTSLVVRARADPALYERDLPHGARSAALPLLLALLAAEGVGVVGILRRWRWLFWFLLLAFGLSVLRVPLRAAQWAGLGGSGEPTWYDLARGAVSLLQGGIAARSIPRARSTPPARSSAGCTGSISLTG